MIDFNSASPQWIPSPNNDNDPYLSLMQEMSRCGYPVRELIGNGEIQRFKIEGKKGLPGWYVFYSDPGGLSAAVFGDWITGSVNKWCSHKDLTEEQKIQVKRMIDQGEEKRKAESEKNALAAATDAQQRMRREVKYVQDHPYLEKKEVVTKNLYLDGKHLLVPITNWEDEILGVQEIDPDGKKKFPYGTKVKGNFFKIQGDDVVVICEGMATGATIHAAVGATVLVAFSAQNLIKVAIDYKKRFPMASLVICGDADKTGREAAEKAAYETSGALRIPKLEEGQGTDFNDVQIAGGIDLVKQQLKHAPSDSTELVVLSEKDTVVKITEPPPPTRYALNYKDQGLLPFRITGILCAAGGTGKTYWLLNVAYAAAMGGNFGNISAPAPTKTLVVLAEDPKEEIDQRLWEIGKGYYPPNLHVACIKEKIFGGFMEENELRTPTLSSTYRWLEQTIEAHPGLELLIFDPKSKLYGLDENNNDHCARWIGCLEALCGKYNITTLFAHHTNRASSGEINQDMSRGGSALIDGCRWQAGLVTMDEKTAEKYGVDQYDYTIFDVAKHNYSARIPRKIIYKKGSMGRPEEVDLQSERIKKIAAVLLEFLRLDTQKYTRKDLSKNKAGIEIAKEITDSFDENFKVNARDDLPKCIDFLLQENRIAEVLEPNGKSGPDPLVLQVIN